MRIRELAEFILLTSPRPGKAKEESHKFSLTFTLQTSSVLLMEGVIEKISPLEFSYHPTMHLEPAHLTLGSPELRERTFSTSG